MAVIKGGIIRGGAIYRGSTVHVYFYINILNILFVYRTDNPCWFLDYEVDANCLDEHCCTALVSHCHHGMIKL